MKWTILFLLLAALPAAAQPNATLTVLVRAEGSPVSGARVSAGSVAQRTDAAGQTSLTLPVGQHELRVTHAGFAAFALTLGLRADTTITVELEHEVHEIEEIIVSTTRSERRLEDEPLRIEVVSREEVEEKLLMTPGDIAMLLNETSGLRVQPTATTLGGAGIRIQGLRGRYTQLLADGLPLYGGQSAALGPLQIPPMDLEQVEVIKGAASALYGSTALGGVVNLISRRPRGARELLLNQTSRGGTDAVAWWEGADRPVSYTVLGGLHAQDSEDIDDDGWADLPEYRRALVRPRVFWRGADGSSALFTASTMWEERQGGGLPGGHPYREKLETRRGDAGVNARIVVSESRQLTVRGSVSRQRHEHEFGGLRERDAHSTALLETALLGSTGAHTWVVGAALQHDGYDAYELNQHDYRFTVPALFAQDEVQLHDDVIAALSARVDRHSEYGTFLNPRGSVLYRPGEWSLRASAGSGYFAPGPFTEITEATGLRRLELWRGRLDAERAVSGSVDLGRTLGPFELNASVFASRIEDAVQTVVPSPNRLAVVNADGVTRTWGAELFARYHAGPLHASFTYAHTRSTEPAPDTAARRTTPLTPEHTAGLVAMYELEGRGRIAAELYYIGEQQLDDNPFRTRSEAYFITGVLAEWRVGRVRLFVNAENLLNERQTRYDPLVRQARSPYGLWAVDLWAPVEGRVVNGGLRVDL